MPMTAPVKEGAKVPMSVRMATTLLVVVVRGDGSWARAELAASRRKKADSILNVAGRSTVEARTQDDFGREARSVGFEQHFKYPHRLVVDMQARSKPGIVVVQGEYFCAACH